MTLVCGHDAAGGKTGGGAGAGRRRRQPNWSSPRPRFCADEGEAPHHHRKQSAWTKYIYTMYSKLQSQLLTHDRAKWLDFYGQTSLKLHVRVCHGNVIAIDSPSARHKIFKIDDQKTLSHGYSNEDHVYLH
uniref:Uncharacterized protein n=1 Tax=Leersia perrieri TaxID=77586 RepID=A0A0D9W623_9ORYZ